MVLATDPTNATVAWVSWAPIATSVFDTQVANMALVDNRSSATATKVGVDCFATKVGFLWFLCNWLTLRFHFFQISTTVPTINHAWTVQPVPTLEQVTTRVRVGLVTPVSTARSRSKPALWNPVTTVPPVAKRAQTTLACARKVSLANIAKRLPRRARRNRARMVQPAWIWTTMNHRTLVTNACVHLVGKATIVTLKPTYVRHHRVKMVRFSGFFKCNFI